MRFGFLGATLVASTVWSSPASAQLINLDSVLTELLGRLQTAADIAAIRDINVDLLSPDGPLVDLSNGLNLLEVDVAQQGSLIGGIEADLLNVNEGLLTLRTDVNTQFGDLRTSIGDLRGDVDVDLASLRQADVVIRQEISAQGGQISATNARVSGQETVIVALNERQTITEQTLTLQHEAIGRQGKNLASLEGSVRGLSDRMETRFRDVDQRLDTANEGVAMALAMKSPYVAPDKTFALSGGWGGFEGESAFAVSGAVRTGQYVQLDAGIAVGAQGGNVGGRAGATVSW